MKFKNFLLPLSLVSFALLGCAPTSQPSQSSSQITDESSSEVEETTTTTPEKSQWSNEELALMEEHLNGNHVPFIALSGANVSYDSEFDTISVQKANASIEDMEGYHAALLDLGWLDSSEVDPDTGEVDLGAVLPLEKEKQLEALYCNICLIDNVFYADYYYSILPAEWDPVEVEALVTTIVGEKIAIPAPSFAFNCYQVNDSLAELGLGYIFIYVDTDLSQTYVEQLLAAGYVKEVLEDETYYNDPTSKLSIGVSFDAEYSTIDLELSYIGE